MNELKSERLLKDETLRHAEYYGMIQKYDFLYQQAKQKQSFKKLMPLIISEENILLAYRNIKRNKGSLTSACDKVDIKLLEKMKINDFLNETRKRLENYQPEKVRRKEIPKPNGKTRPLGIPSMWDRIIQQCIFQVLEPVCEAYFCEHSYGFRPNRSAEHAIADSVKKINLQHLMYVVDVDIKGFFDEVNHTKLMRQLWTLGIHDKQLLVVIRKILKAPVKMPDGKTILPTKGTPQGGILSPLLANVYLNEFDWWVMKQWEDMPLQTITPQYNSNGSRNKSSEYTAMRATRLKEMYIVRYADDFKIFTNCRESARKIYIATQKWLKERLKLTVSEEKSKITNLKKHSSEFLGFTLRAIKNGKRKNQVKYTANTGITKKAIRKTKQDLVNQIKKIQNSPNSDKTIREIYRYNSIVIGKHNYYRIATNASMQLRTIAHQLETMMYNRFPKATSCNKPNTNGFTHIGEYTGKDKGIIPYLKSKGVRYLMKRPILPLSYIKHKSPMMKKRGINKYTVTGRSLIHNNLVDVTETQLKWLRNNPIINQRATIEYNDNRISLYVAQKGKCAISKEKLLPWEIHCHHKKAWYKSKDDSYQNLIIVKEEIHKLIHATDSKTIQNLIKILELSEPQLKKVNELRSLLDNNKICILNKSKNNSE